MQSQGQLETSRLSGDVCSYVCQTFVATMPCPWQASHIKMPSPFPAWSKATAQMNKWCRLAFAGSEV